MNHYQKTRSFQKDIRREQIDSFFSNKRIKLLESYQIPISNDMEVERESIKDIDPSNMSPQQMHKVAQLVQTEAGIRLIQKAQYEQHLIKYLREEWTKTDQQFYSTYILCNIYYISSSAPPEHLTLLLLQLLDVADIRSLENIFFLMVNAFSDHSQWLLVLLNQHQLGEKLFKLFGRFPHPSSQFLTLFVHLVFKVIQVAGKHSTLLKLQKNLLMIVMQDYVPERKQLIRRGIYAYHCLFNHFSENMRQITIKHGVLFKIMSHIDVLNDKRIINIVLQIITKSLEIITVPYLSEKVLPFLIKLYEIGFQIGEPSKIYQPRDLKLQSIRVVAKLLQSTKLDADTFCSLKLAQMMLHDLETSDDPDILLELSYVFVQVFLNTSNTMLKDTLKQLFARAHRYNPNNYEFDVYLHQFSVNI